MNWPTKTMEVIFCVFNKLIYPKWDWKMLQSNRLSWRCTKKNNERKKRSKNTVGTLLLFDLQSNETEKTFTKYAIMWKKNVHIEWLYLVINFNRWQLTNSNEMRHAKIIRSKRMMETNAIFSVQRMATFPVDLVQKAFSTIDFPLNQSNFSASTLNSVACRPKACGVTGWFDGQMNKRNHFARLKTQQWSTIRRRSFGQSRAFPFIYLTLRLKVLWKKMRCIEKATRATKDQ